MLRNPGRTLDNIPLQGLVLGNYSKEPKKGRVYAVKVGFRIQGFRVLLGSPGEKPDSRKKGTRLVEGATRESGQGLLKIQGFRLADSKTDRRPEHFLKFQLFEV